MSTPILHPTFEGSSPFFLDKDITIEIKMFFLH